jgi:hypothetical protein
MFYLKDEGHLRPRLPSIIISAILETNDVKGTGYFIMVAETGCVKQDNKLEPTKDYLLVKVGCLGRACKRCKPSEGNEERTRYYRSWNGPA